MQAARRTSEPTSIGMPADELAYHLRVKLETVEGWLSGRLQKPPYFALAVKAARARLHPVPSSIVEAHTERLGLKRQHVRYWIETGQVPVPARMAVAWIIHNRITGRD